VIPPPSGPETKGLPGRLLAAGKIALLLAWFAVQPAAFAQTNVFEINSPPVPANPIDALVFNRLKTLGLQPANPCSDAVFVRRVFLDVTGTLPTAREAMDFIQSREPDKRARLIDRLLARDEFADYWAMRWSELLRIKAEYPINLWPEAAQAYHQWIRAAIADNMPYDRFARELLTASGSDFQYPPANFFRAMQNRDPQGIARAVALAFMGERAEKWPTNQLAGMAAFFSQVGYKPTDEWKEEIVFWDSDSTNARQTAVFPDGRKIQLPPDRDPREIFAGWLVDGNNPQFTRCIVNRVWAWLLGRGIIQEPDDIRPDNPPANPELLTYLQGELVASHFNLKHIYRLILNSQTYQLSCVARSDGPGAEANFAAYPLRQLDAEVLADALCKITGTGEKYSSPIPEPYTFIPPNERSVALPDGSISSAFLELFGRPARDTGLDSERNNRPTASQKLHLLNSSHIRNKLAQSPKLLAIARLPEGPREIVAGLYLSILSRFPTPEELQIAGARFEPGADPRDATIDVAWALINSAEFIYRH
jgi:hypothetical protein